MSEGKGGKREVRGGYGIASVKVKHSNISGGMQLLFSCFSISVTTSQSTQVWEQKRRTVRLVY